MPLRNKRASFRYHGPSRAPEESPKPAAALLPGRGTAATWPLQKLPSHTRDAVTGFGDLTYLSRVRPHHRISPGFSEDTEL